MPKFNLSYSDLWCDLCEEVKHRDGGIAEREFRAAFIDAWDLFQEDYCVEARKERAFKEHFYARYTPVFAW